MIIDFHNHIGKDIEGLSQNEEQLLSSMKENNITKSVIFPFNQKNLIQSSIDLPNNPNLIKFLRFNPNTTTEQELEENIKQFKGIKLHPTSQNFNPLKKSFFKFYEIIQKQNIPILFHSNYNNNFSNPNNILKLAELFPKLKLIIGHFARNSDIIFENINNHKNVYIETSIASSTPYTIERALTLMGKNKLIFGSDSPYSDQFIELNKILRSNISEKNKQLILHQNADKIL